MSPSRLLPLFRYPELAPFRELVAATEVGRELLSRIDSIPVALKVEPERLRAVGASAQAQAASRHGPATVWMSSTKWIDPVPPIVDSALFDVVMPSAAELNLYTAIDLLHEGTHIGQYAAMKGGYFRVLGNELATQGARLLSRLSDSPRVHAVARRPTYAEAAFRREAEAFLAQSTFTHELAAKGIIKYDPSSIRTYEDAIETVMATPVYHQQGKYLRRKTALYASTAAAVGGAALVPYREPTSRSGVHR